MKTFIYIVSFVATIATTWVYLNLNSSNGDSLGTHSAESSQMKNDSPETQALAEPESKSDRLETDSNSEKKIVVRKPVLPERPPSPQVANSESTELGTLPTEINLLTPRHKFIKKLRKMKRRSRGDYSNILNLIADELARTDSDRLDRDFLETEWFKHAFEQPGPVAVDALREFARKNCKHPEVLNEYAWKIVERDQNGESVPMNMINAAIYTIELALDCNYIPAHVYDTMSHLYEMQGNLDRAIEFAALAAKNSAQEYTAEYNTRLRKLRNDKRALRSLGITALKSELISDSIH